VRGRYDEVFVPSPLTSRSPARTSRTTGERAEDGSTDARLVR